MKQKTVTPGLSPTSPSAPRVTLTLGQFKKTADRRMAKGHNESELFRYKPLIYV